VNTMTRIALTSGFMGRKYLVGLTCYTCRVLGVEAIILLGDVVSPSIIQRLLQCGMRVYGVLGRYDDASVASTLSSMDSLIDCKLVKIGDLNVYGYGLSGCKHRFTEGGVVDLLVSSLPGRIYTCCNEVRGPIDPLVELLKPRLVATGGCSKPCRKHQLLSPGGVEHGYIGVVESEGNKLDVILLNMYSVIRTL